jgi:hypothetical protein
MLFIIAAEAANKHWLPVAAAYRQAWLTAIVMAGAQAFAGLGITAKGFDDSQRSLR